jgi:hypothetical protein
MTPQRRRYKPGGTVAGPVPHEYCRNFLRNSWYYTPADVVKLERRRPTGPWRRFALSTKPAASSPSTCRSNYRYLYWEGIGVQRA